MNSDGQIQLVNMALSSCAFTADLVDRLTLTPNCGPRKRHVVDTINAMKPDVVVIANLYRLGKRADSERNMSPGDWSGSMQKIIDEFRASTGKVVLLAGPPGELDIKDCYAKRGNVPADCVGRVNKQWSEMATIERELAADIGGSWIDSRPWFCTSGQLCPSFAGLTATKSDEFHLAPAYGAKIYPVIAESFRQAGVF